MVEVLNAVPLIGGWILDLMLGDPVWLPHPVVWFGKIIAFLERKFNHGGYKRLKGAAIVVGLICMTFLCTWCLLRFFAFSTMLKVVMEILLVFYCLAGTTLSREVRGVFRAADISLQAGRRQVARIVGRDTATLSDQEVKIAALETGAENLSDGVVAPLFWYAILGVPGMVTYKMINTLDSMIGYKTERYREFGTVAARIDDVANYLPARITAFLMLLAAGRLRLWGFVKCFSRHHLSPNSGWPEAALAGILDCRFGGAHIYFGELIDKPFIGKTDRNVNTSDMKIALRINSIVELMTVGLAALATLSRIMIHHDSCYVIG